MIEFFCENVEMPDLDYDRIREWIFRVAASHGYEVGNLTYCFCDDPYILETNRRFLNHDYFTDIITFDYTRPVRNRAAVAADNGADDGIVSSGDYTASATKICRGRIGGDMIISLDTVRTNADGLGVPYMKELLRVIIHGVLHLCGIDDKGPGEREIMEAHENEAIFLIKSGEWRVESEEPFSNIKI